MRDTTTVGDELTETAGVPSADVKTAKDSGKRKKEREASLWTDALYDLRRNPVFVIGAALVLFMGVVSLFPGMFTGIDAYAPCNLRDSMLKPGSEHIFGTDVQGCDVYAKTVYAASNSITVGIATTVMVVLVGVTSGLLAGWFGGFVDTALSRFAEIFFAIPLMLGGMLIMSGLGKGNAWTVSLVLAVLGWPQIFRIMRSSVLANKNNDYVMAARALGAGTWRITLRHIMPNAIAPVIVVGAISLGVYISAEAALSYLGVGVQAPEISWGLMVSDAQARFLQAPHMLLFPAAALSVTVLAFIMVGDAVRDALDPKLR